MKTQLQPIHDRVLVRRKSTETLTPSGLHIPVGGQEKAAYGEVLAVGNGLRDNGEVVAMSVQPGNVIVFGKFAGSEVEHEGEKLLILREAEVFAVVQLSQ